MLLENIFKAAPHLIKNRPRLPNISQRIQCKKTENSLISDA